VSAYAVIKTGGKQLRAAVDDLIVVEKLEGEPGDVVSFGEVLLHADGSNVTVGAPTIADFQVHGEIADQRRADKIIVFKKKRRQNYRRKKGHRQHETVVRITALGGDAPAAKPKAAAKKTTRKKKAAPAAAEGQE
jgi:large subunit ribosomal protein L21